jgi:hypothetical protein
MLCNTFCIPSRNTLFPMFYVGKSYPRNYPMDPWWIQIKKLQQRMATNSERIKTKKRIIKRVYI